MYGAVDNQVSTSSLQTDSVTPIEFKVYRRRWLYLICVCLANMSNAIVRVVFVYRKILMFEKII